MTQAGGKLSTKLIEVFHTYSQTQAIQFFVMYGQTEATARMSYLPPQYLGEKIGSIGKAIPTGRFRIDDETSELIYAGPNVFGGYAESPADLAHFESLSELHTGDLARVDDDGFYYITGRLKRFAKIFGQRLNLDEVESLLKNQFVGLSFAALGLNDEKLLITVEDETLTEQAVKDFLKDKLQIHPSVIRFQRMEKLPLTANGKINYRELSMKYEV
jgi:acyl-CoA synthetase (AMP-forming)/AMP-acid ligase II